MSPIGIIILVVVLLLIFGGLGGHYGGSWFGPGTSVGTTGRGGWSPVYGGGGIALVLLVLLVLYLLGYL